MRDRPRGVRGALAGLPQRFGGAVCRGRQRQLLANLALPDIGAETVYRAEYACALPWDMPEGRKLLASLKKQE